eukprot:COSAG06_NODE_60153_length_272_cov_0.294798_1_plen_40_part_10
MPNKGLIFVGFVDFDRGPPTNSGALIHDHKKKRGMSLQRR